MPFLDPSTLKTLVAAQSVNLPLVDDEPIHIPGYIQPHGVMLTLREPQLEILQVSENVEQVFGIAAEAILGQPLSVICPNAQVKTIAQYLSQSNLEVVNPLEIKIRNFFPGVEAKTRFQQFKAVMHRADGVVILEAEPIVSPESQQPLTFYNLLRQATFALHNVNGLEELLQTLAQEVKALTGFDRVMVYRFAPDHGGQVVAEAQEPQLESFLGLHFPAIDIPPLARTLFCSNWLRLIPNVQAAPARLMPALNPVTNAPLDMSMAVLRGVSPCHSEYLGNMGVTATLVVSLIHGQQLWGLIACHHYSPKFVGYETRKACEFLGQFASVGLMHQQDQEMSRYRAQIKAIQQQMRSAFSHKAGPVEQVLAHNEAALLDLVHAQGAAIVLDQQISLLGQTPPLEAVEALMSWLRQQDQQELIATDRLSQLYPDGKALRDTASGILAIAIVLHQKSYHILWFRPEQIQTVNWAGNPDETLAIEGPHGMRLCPRKSFELWKETVQDTSLPWLAVEIEAALEMRNTLMLVLLKFSQVALEQTAERAAIANRAKSQFLAKMSHELRTPLNAILGFTQLMRRNQDTSSEFHGHLSIINRSGEHLLALINDVLEMSKIEAGQTVLTEICFDLHQLIHIIRDLFLLKAAEKGLGLKIERDATVPRYVFGDEAKLRQILINLLNNAVKFTASGSVTLRVHAAQPALVPPAVAHPESHILLVLEVEDTGAGIDRADLESIFEAFVQTEQGRHAQGTGLGLSISRQFARLMGGDITVRSILGQGSTFVCQVMLERAEASNLMQPSETRYVVGLEPGQPTYRILVVEDVPENRQLLVRLLEAAGFEVRAVENGEEAIVLWQNWHPHLIWMDIQMPVMDGYEATQQIRAIEAVRKAAGSDTASPVDGSTPPTVIIALTAYAFEADRAASLRAGCNDYVAKPFKEMVLFEKMAQHLGVRYRYSEETALANSALPALQPLEAQDLQVMPPPWRHQVHEAALDLNDLQLYELIEQIPKQAQHLSTALKHLVDNFNFETIVTLTQP